ncbi:AbfB domain-containing protein [Streptomyces sp. NPDC003635]
MPHDKSRPPQERSWESGWAPDTSRTPGTRRLWLAGALALVTVAACVTAIAVTRTTPDDPSRSAAESTGAYPPGLISFAGPSAGPTTPGPLPSRAAERPATHPPKTGTPGPAPTTTHKESPPASPSPKPTATSPWRTLRSVNYPDRHWQITDGLVVLGAPASPVRLLKGLARPSCYSFATADGRYLRHRDFVLRAEPNDGSALFSQDATFCPRATTHPGAIMLESVNHPGRYLRHQDFRLRLDPFQSSELYRADSAFQVVS